MRSRSDGMGTVGTGKATETRATMTAAGGRGRGTRGGVIARGTDGLGAPPDPKPQPSAGGAVPVAAALRRRVRVEMRPERGKAARGAGSPGGEGADAAGSVITADFFLCEVLVGTGACHATVAVAAGASAKPLSPLEGTTKTEAKARLAVGEK